MSKKKVYCSECKWFDWVGWNECLCKHPKNVKVTTRTKEGTWLSRPHELKNTHYLLSPKKLNENNDCPLFQQED